MKNSSKNFRGSNKEFNRNSDIGYYSKNTKRSDKNERFLNKSANNKNVENSNKKEKNNSFSSLKRRNSRFKSNTEFPNQNSDRHQEFTNKRNFDDWIWGKHSVYEALSSDSCLLYTSPSPRDY